MSNLRRLPSAGWEDLRTWTGPRYNPLVNRATISLLNSIGEPIPSIGLRATDGYLLNLRSWVGKSPVAHLFLAGPTLTGAGRTAADAMVRALAAEIGRLTAAGIAVTGVTTDNERQQAEFAAALPPVPPAQRRAADRLPGTGGAPGRSARQHERRETDAHRASTRPGCSAACTTIRTHACWRRSSSRSSESPFRPRPMLAVRTYAAGEPLRLDDVPVPTPRGTEVLIRVAGAGVCHTDLHRSDQSDSSRASGDLGPRGGRLDRGHGGRCRGAPAKGAAQGGRAGRGLRRGGLLGSVATASRGDEQRCEFSRAPGSGRWRLRRVPSSFPIPATSSR